MAVLPGGCLGTDRLAGDHPRRVLASGKVIRGISGSGSVGPDGRTLTLQMPAAPPPCPGEPATTLQPVVELTTVTVRVSLRTVTPRRDTGGCVRDLALRMTSYTVALDAPLGNRVVLDAHGNVFPVKLTR